MSKLKRYTLPLPEEIYNEIKAQAEKHDKSMKEVLRQCLKFGLTAMKIEDDPNADIYFKEIVQTQDTDAQPIVKEQIVRFMW